jgi:hypothetical protein
VSSCRHTQRSSVRTLFTSSPKLLARCVVTSCVGLCICTATPMAFAQAAAAAAERPNMTSQEKATSHFERAVELYEDGSLDAALIEFERAYTAVPDYRLLYNLGQVQVQRAEYVAAIGLFKDYLAGGGTEIAEPRRQRVEQEIAKLMNRVAPLWVETSEVGAQLFVNDLAAGSLPMKEPVLVNAGLCNVRVEKPGFETRSLQLKVAGGDQPRVSLPLVAVRNVAPTTPGRKVNAGGAGDPTETQVTYAPFWISLGATVVLGAASGGFALSALESKRKLDSELNKLPADRSLVKEYSNRTGTSSLWADVCGAAAVVAGGTALYFVLSPPSSGTAPETAAIHSLKLTTDGRSAMLSGRF